MSIAGDESHNTNQPVSPVFCFLCSQHITVESLHRLNLVEEQVDDGVVDIDIAIVKSETEPDTNEPDESYAQNTTRHVISTLDFKDFIQSQFKAVKTLAGIAGLQSGSLLPFCTSCGQRLIQLYELQIQLTSLQRQYDELKESVEREFNGTYMSRQAVQEQEFILPHSLLDETKPIPIPDLKTPNLTNCRVNLTRLKTSLIASTTGWKLSKSSIQTASSNSNKKINTPFNCHLCTKAFNKRIALTRHLRIHRGVKRRQCPQCPKRFHRNYSLKIHLLSHTKTKEHGCHLCSAMFSVKDSLKRHLAHQHEIFASSAQQCRQCDAKFYRPAELRAHVRNFHSYDSEKTTPRLNLDDDDDTTCRFCGASFLTKALLRSHTNAAHRKSCFQCEICGHQLVSGHGLNTHMYRVHGESSFQCTKCNGRLYSQFGLHAHMQSQHAERKMVRCDYCKDEFVNAYKKRQHMVKGHPAEHLGGSRVSCCACWKTFGSVPEMEQHQIVEHDLLKCRECNKIQSSKQSYARHLLVHSLERPFKCDFCEKSFKQQSYCKKHMKLFHGQQQQPLGVGVELPQV